MYEKKFISFNRGLFLTYKSPRFDKEDSVEIMEYTNAQVKSVFKIVGSKFHIWSLFPEEWSKILDEVKNTKEFHKCILELHKSNTATNYSILCSFRDWLAEVDGMDNPCPKVKDLHCRIQHYLDKSYLDKARLQDLQTATRRYHRFCWLLNAYYFQNSPNQVVLTRLLDILIKLKQVQECFAAEDALVECLENRLHMLENSVKLLDLRYGIKQIETQANVSV